jgi:hypothetical protein
VRPAPPTEVTIRYATTVDTLTDAWAFVMAHLEHVGPDPSIQITPAWIVSVDATLGDETRPPRHFEVVISGMVETHEEDSLPPPTRDLEDE